MAKWEITDRILDAEGIRERPQVEAETVNMTVNHGRVLFCFFDAQGEVLAMVHGEELSVIKLEDSAAS